MAEGTVQGDAAVHFSDGVTTRRGSRRPAERPGHRQTDSSWCAGPRRPKYRGKVVGVPRVCGCLCALEQRDLSLLVSEAGSRPSVRPWEAVKGNAGDWERPSQGESGLGLVCNRLFEPRQRFCSTIKSGAVFSSTNGS